MKANRSNYICRKPVNRLSSSALSLTSRYSSAHNIIITHIHTCPEDLQLIITGKVSIHVEYISFLDY